MKTSGLTRSLGSFCRCAGVTGLQIDDAVTPGEIAEEIPGLHYGWLLPQPAVKFSRKTLLYSGLESTGEGVANLVVDRQQLLAGKGHCANAHDRNERGDQAILDGGNAGFISDETREEGLHRKDPFRGFA